MRLNIGEPGMNWVIQTKSKTKNEGKHKLCLEALQFICPEKLNDI